MQNKKNEVNSIIKSLASIDSWEDDNLAKSIESILRRYFYTPTSLIYHSCTLLSYHLSFSKDISPPSPGCIIFLIRLPIKLDIPMVSDTIETIQNEIIKTGLGRWPNFLFLFGPYRIYYKYFFDNFPNFNINNIGGFKKLLLSSDPKKESWIRLEKNITEIYKCPFHYLGPCSPEMFVGRRTLINEILFGSQNGYAIAGGRRIGKSSILFKIKSEAGLIDNGKKYLPLYFDCSTFNNFQNIMNEITLKLAPKHYVSGKRFHMPFEGFLGRTKGLSGKTLLILLDEMDPLLEKGKKENRIKEEGKKFFKNIRKESNKQNLRVVISGFREVSEMISDNNHPFYNLCEGKYLKTLTHQETGQLISVPFSRMGVTLEDESDIINSIYNSTKGHPSVIQFIAKKLFTENAQKLISPDILATQYESGDLIDFVLENFVMNANSLERLICLLCVEEEEFSIDTVLKKFEDEDLKIKEADKKIFSALVNLKNNNILIHEKGRYRFLYPLMSQILEEYYKSPYVIKTLKREVADESK